MSSGCPAAGDRVENVVTGGAGQALGGRLETVSRQQSQALRTAIDRLLVREDRHAIVHAAERQLWMRLVNDAP